MSNSVRRIFIANNLPKMVPESFRGVFQTKKTGCRYSDFPYLCRLKLSRYFKSKKYGENFKESAGYARVGNVSHDCIGT